jgi:hypothetical protein
MMRSSILYMYNVLKGDQFRLLELQSGASDNPLVCPIHVAFLATKPYVQAVSYYWDTGPRLRHILCSNKVFLITSDPAIALQHLRSATDGRIL